MERAYLVGTALSAVALLAALSRGGSFRRPAVSVDDSSPPMIASVRSSESAPRDSGVPQPFRDEVRS
jgi:hypothetical protein